MAVQMLLEDGLGEPASHGSTAAKGQEEPDYLSGGLSNCLLPIRDILAMEEGGREAPGRTLGLETPQIMLLY